MKRFTFIAYLLFMGVTLIYGHEDLAEITRNTLKDSVTMTKDSIQTSYNPLLYYGIVSETIKIKQPQKLSLSMPNIDVSCDRLKNMELINMFCYMLR